MFINPFSLTAKMGLMDILIDFILHLDKYAGMILQNFGIFTYLILFAVIFCETGLVIMPFLPGDSLLFVFGTFASVGAVNIFILYITFLSAAILGDTVNYWIGHYFGAKVFAKSRFFKKEYLETTKEFYKKHGGKSIILARFVPVMRTFAPFVAGIGNMDYVRFFSFNIMGGLIWVTLFLLGGFFFGEIPFVQKNLGLVLLITISVSFIPQIIKYLRHKSRK